MPTILVVEDDPHLREILVTLVEALGYQPLSAENGFEAMAELAEQEADLVITDVNMDGMNGIELAAAIRREYPHMPVMALTGRDKVGLEDIFDLVLTKPSGVFELEKAITYFLNPAPASI
jgi:CheY-like chemotaxis protein